MNDNTIEQGKMTVAPTALAEAGIAAAKEAGFQVQQGGPKDGPELNGLWWWTLTQPGWSGVETSPDEFVTESEAWSDAVRALNEDTELIVKMPKIGVRAVKVSAGDANSEHGTVCEANAAIAGYQASRLCNKIDVTVEFQDDRYARITLYLSDQPDIAEKFMSTHKSVRERLTGGFGDTDFERHMEKGYKVLDADLVRFFAKYSLAEAAATHSSQH